MATSNFQELPFKVSARAARLIGRENVANSEGAIIELVKNSYDADASFCALYFDENSFLHIFDNGHGMTDVTIKKHWMTIGTNNKEVDIKTDSGRVRTGAKGIGRFALDKLGKKCELHTLPTESPIGYVWNVNWDDFEGKDSATIGEITAKLKNIDPSDFHKNVKKIITSKPFFKTIKQEENLGNGTLISIDTLRDEWGKAQLDKLFKNLSSLIPPKEEKDFSIFLFSHIFPYDYGLVNSEACDDFDYKVSVKCDSRQNANITITRNEIDLKKLGNDLFKRQGMKKFPYDKKTFLKKSFTVKYKIKELVPGFKEKDKNDVLGKIGPFGFTFYFMKKQITADHKERFSYKSFDHALRNLWLDEHVGIKIFRDGFRVRPYGEPRGGASDWLLLGARAQSSPAGIAKVGGGYKVREYNISGIVEISRLTNLEFQDKMNREGILDNQTFDVFRQVLIGVISKFEADRSYIAREIDALYRENDRDGQIAEQAEGIKKQQKKLKGSTKKTADEEKIEILSEHSDRLEEKIEELVNEQKILRVLASTGAMISSFAHELHGLRNHLLKRSDTMGQLISPYVSIDDASKLPSHRNPYVFIKHMRENDSKLVSWMQFSLGSVRKDKRKKKNLYLHRYFESLEKSWANHLADRQTTLSLKVSNPEIMLKAFEVDFDTIFNNLIVNSLDAFQRNTFPEKRKISINCKTQGNFIVVNYSDNGPGLSKDIKSSNEIFDIYFSTKRDPNTGEQIGTGIGMWLVKATIEEYGGDIVLAPKDKEGFSVSLTFRV